MLVDVFDNTLGETIHNCFGQIMWKIQGEKILQSKRDFDIGAVVVMQKVKRCSNKKIVLLTSYLIKYLKM